MNRVREHFAQLSNAFGIYFLLFMAVSQMILKGVVYNLCTSSLLPLYKSELGVDASQLQFYMLIIMVPWSIKPLIGLVSDLSQIFGYHKKPWLYVSVCSAVLCSCFTFVAFLTRSPLGIALCYMGIQFQVATFDLMTEATYSAIMRDNPQIGTSGVTLVQGYQHMGGIIAMIFVGTLAQNRLYNVIFSIILVCCIAPIVPVLLKWLPEERYPEGEPVLGNNPNWRMRLGAVVQVKAPPSSSKSMIAVIAFVGIAAPITAIVVNAGDPLIGLSVALLFTVVALVASYHVFPERMIMRIALYQVLIALSRPAIGGALDFFYMATPDCLPDGPHFTYAYYLTYAGIVGTVASFVVTLLYEPTLAKLNFRTVLLLTTVLSSLIGSSDLFIVTRTNIALGIPDSVAYMVGESVFEPLLNMMYYIPASALLSKVVPKGMESSSFAFQAGITNFAYMVSELSGGIIFRLGGIKTTMPGCNFDNLWWLVLGCHVLLPLVVSIPAAWLIPNIPQTADMRTNSETEDGPLIKEGEEFHLSEVDESDDREDVLGGAEL